MIMGYRFFRFPNDLGRVAATSRSIPCRSDGGPGGGPWRWTARLAPELAIARPGGRLHRPGRYSRAFLDAGTALAAPWRAGLCSVFAEEIEAAHGAKYFMAMHDRLLTGCSVNSGIVMSHFPIGKCDICRNRKRKRSQTRHYRSRGDCRRTILRCGRRGGGPFSAAESV